MTDKDILHLIPYGKDKAITKAELCSLTGMGERTIRDVIHRLRKKGEYIMSFSHSAGFWRTNDADEVKKFLKQAKHRRSELYYPEMTRKLYAETGQKYTTVREHERRVTA